MNPFRPNQTEHVTGQDLLALHLNELSSDRAVAVRGIVGDDPALAAESASIAAALAAVSLNASAANRKPLALSEAIFDRNWQAIRPQLGAYAPIPSRWHRLTRPALAAGLLAAVGAGIALFVYTHRAAAPDFRPPNDRTEAADRNQMSSSPHHPLVSASPDEQADLRVEEPGFTGNFSSGVYLPKSQSPNAPIRLIAPAFRPQPMLDTPATEPSRQPLLTRAPAPPPLTLEPQPSSVLAAGQDHAQFQNGTTQNVNSAKPGAHVSGNPRNPHPLDLMLGVGALLIPEQGNTIASAEPNTTTVNRAAVAMVSLHQRFRPALGYRVTLSYTRENLILSNGGDDFIDSRLFEGAATYVIEGPQSKRLSTSVDAGGAFMAFVPLGNGDSSISYSTRGAVVAGVNLDYAITKHIGARFGYRLQIYKSPDFGTSGATYPVPTPIVVDNEPFLGVTYTLGKK